MNLRLLLVALFPAVLFGCASTPSTSVARRGENDVEAAAYKALYSVAPELRRERLELINYASQELPPYGELQAEFRYENDPQDRSRVLLLRRSGSRHGSPARVTLQSGHARWYFEPFPDGGGQERWKVLDRRPYAKSPTKA